MRLPLHWLALLALAVPLIAAAPAPSPRVLARPVPPAADSVEYAPPGPLLIPGAPAPPDTTAAARARRAREFVAAGKAMELDGKPASAISAYRSAVLLDPLVPEAYGRMGALYAAVGEDRQAVACLSQELNGYPGNTAAGRLLGLVLARTGDTTRAIRQLELLTRRDPRDAASWAALGFAYTAAQRKGQAEQALRRALQLDPKRADVHRDLGVLFGSSGRVREARASFAQAAKLAPRDPSVPFNLGNLERREGRAAPALAAYQQAEALDSTFALALQGQAQLLRGLGHDNEAAEVYRRWLRIRPDDHNARLDAIRLYDQLGRKDMALELARAGVRVEPRSSDTHLMHGMALAASGRLREALAALRTSHQLGGNAAERDRAEALIAALRHEAPDSLRALFDADSAAAVRAATPKPLGGR
jgi:tetratricopeptide (TPR) repeat protein